MQAMTHCCAVLALLALMLQHASTIRLAASGKAHRSATKQVNATRVSALHYPFQTIIEDVEDAVGWGADGPSKIPIDVYYESLGPESLLFLNDTLRKVWENDELQARIDVRLFPFGNAQLLVEDQVHSGYRFFHPDQQYPLIVCEHGERECLGNMIQACAIEQLGRASRYVPFVLCMASFGIAAGVELPSWFCGQEQDVDLPSLRECALSEHGHDMMVRSEVSSLPPNLNRTSALWVMVNGTHNADAAHGKLLETVCQIMEPPVPSICHDKEKDSGTKLTSKAKSSRKKRKDGHSDPIFTNSTSHPWKPSFVQSNAPQSKKAFLKKGAKPG